MAIKANPDYLISIHVSSEGGLGDIIAYLPEEVTMSSESNWSPVMDTLFGVPVVGGLSSAAYSAATAAGKATGYQLNPVISSVKGWDGNNPLSWSFSLQFNAEYDPLTEVLIPIYRLLRLTMARKLGNGFVQAPGPSAMKVLQEQLGEAWNNGLGTAINGLVSGAQGIANAGFNSFSSSQPQNTGDENITMAIGRFMTIQNVVITNATPRFDTQFHNGLPISASCETTFEMSFAPVREMLDSMFNGLRSNRSR